MAKFPAGGVFSSFSLSETRDKPVYLQLYQELRSAILSGRLRSGSRLPATRVLASELGVSRNTILSAFDLLMSEGYLAGKIGSGTYVVDALPEDYLLASGAVERSMPSSVVINPELSQRGATIARLSLMTGPTRPAAFTPDIPAYDAFPIDAWTRIIANSWRRITVDMLGYADPAGYLPLREAISAHLQAARMVSCTPEQVIVTSGSQQSFDLIARLLIDPEDAVWIEEPGYIGSRAAFTAAGARLVPVEVDEEGLNVTAGEQLEPRPRIVLVSPSRQYPLGMTLSPDRRTKLLALAQHSNAWIVEDDYDSEYRYRGRPLPALQSMDQGQRVIYLGTFSKALLPSFRLGYLVVPESLATSFRTAKAIIDRHAPLLEQIALHEFMERGYFASHLRKMRALYAERQHALITELRSNLAGFLKVEEADSGMHITAFLPADVNDIVFCQVLLNRGVIARPLSPYYAREPKRNGLILGFPAVPPAQLHMGVLHLVQVAREFGMRGPEGA